jgi:hypothetical protein
MKIEETPKFDGSSFYIWRFRMAFFLTAEDSTGIVDGSIPRSATAYADWDKKIAIALSYIANRVDNSQAHHVSTSTMASVSYTIGRNKSDGTPSPLVE